MAWKCLHVFRLIIYLILLKHQRRIQWDQRTQCWTHSDSPSWEFRHSASDVTWRERGAGSQLSIQNLNDRFKQEFLRNSRPDLNLIHFKSRKPNALPSTYQVPAMATHSYWNTQLNLYGFLREKSVYPWYKSLSCSIVVCGVGKYSHDIWLQTFGECSRSQA